MSSLDLESLKAALRELLNKPGTMTRAEHDKLTPRDAAAFFRHGGKLTNNATPAKPLPRIPAPLPPLTAHRDCFDQLSAESQSDLVAQGYKIVDDRDLQND